jgi:hypothetical protein
MNHPAVIGVIFSAPFAFLLMAVLDKTGEGPWMRFIACYGDRPPGVLTISVGSCLRVHALRGG